MDIKESIFQVKGDILSFAFRRLNNVRVTDDNISEDMEISSRKEETKLI